MTFQTFTKHNHVSKQGLVMRYCTQKSTQKTLPREKLLGERSLISWTSLVSNVLKILNFHILFSIFLNKFYKKLIMMYLDVGMDFFSQHLNFSGYIRAVLHAILTVRLPSYLWMHSGLAPHQSRPTSTSTLVPARLSEVLENHSSCSTSTSDFLVISCTRQSSLRNLSIGSTFTIV